MGRSWPVILVPAESLLGGPLDAQLFVPYIYTFSVPKLNTGTSGIGTPGVMTLPSPLSWQV